jgi:hypothetical protein
MIPNRDWWGKTPLQDSKTLYIAVAVPAAASGIVVLPDDGAVGHAW